MDGLAQNVVDDVTFAEVWPWKGKSVELVVNVLLLLLQELLLISDVFLLSKRMNKFFYK